MIDPFRLTVLKALTATLEQITVANGFQHDLAGRVFRGRMLFTQEDKVPFLSIIEPPGSPDDPEMPPDASGRFTQHPLLIQGFVADDPVNPTDPAYYLLADVQRRLAQERTRSQGYDILGLGERLMGLKIGRGVVRPPDTVVSGDAYFWLPVTLEYAEDLKNPFA